MSDQQQPSDFEKERNARVSADTMFCKVSLTLAFGELARLQADEKQANLFLTERKKFLEELMTDIDDRDTVFGRAFIERFQENVNAMFRAILVEPPAK